MSDGVVRWLMVVVLAAAACAPQEDPLRGNASTPGPSTAPSAPASERTAAVPAPEGRAAPDVLAVTCTADGKTQFPSGRAVSARSDGVHILADNRSGEEASVWTTDVRAGISTHVMSLAPGSHDLACWPLSRHEGKQPAEATVIVTDPQRHWVATELQCAGGFAQHQINDYLAGSSGEAGDPVDLARKQADADLRDASFVRGGYPDSPSPTVVARRDGKTVAAFSFTPTTKGRWLLGSLERC